MKWANDLNGYFSKEYIQMANKHMKRWSIPLAIEEMQIKTTMRYYSIPTKMAMIQKKKKKVTGAGEDMEKLEPSYTVGGNANCCSNYGK